MKRLKTHPHGLKRTAMALQVPETLLNLDTQHLRGLLEAIIARLTACELQSTRCEFTLQSLQEREAP